MLNIEVIYYLNEEGLKYFPTWYKKCKNETSKQTGFVRMCSKISNCQKAYIVMLDFESQKTLEKWSEKNIHNELANDIEQYCIDAPEVKFREF